LSVAFSPDGEKFFTGGADRRASLWDATNCRPITQRFHDSVVSAVAFSPDGKSILTGTNNGAWQLWNADGGAPRLGPFSHRIFDGSARAARPSRRVCRIADR